MTTTASLALGALVLPCAAWGQTTASATVDVHVQQAVDCDLTWQSTATEARNISVAPPYNDNDAVLLSCLYNTGSTAFAISANVQKTGPAWDLSAQLTDDDSTFGLLWAETTGQGYYAFGTSQAYPNGAVGTDWFQKSYSWHAIVASTQDPGDYTFVVTLTATMI